MCESSKEEKAVKKMFVAILAVLLSAGLVACETMKGFGRDLSKAGDKIEQAAKK